MSLLILRFPEREFQKNNPKYEEQGLYPLFCSCPHHKIQEKRIRECVHTYKCLVCGYIIEIDSSD